MTDRAKRFIEKNVKKYTIYVQDHEPIECVRQEHFADLLEQFLKESLPTDEEIEKRFPIVSVINIDPQSQSAFDKSNISSRDERYGSKWCRDFVREEPKKEKKEAMPCITCLWNKTLNHSLCSFCTPKHIYWKAIPVDYKVSPTEKKEPTLEDEINALKEPTVENATTRDLLTELIKRNLK
jgi:hypothetical protein